MTCCEYCKKHGISCIPRWGPKEEGLQLAKQIPIPDDAVINVVDGQRLHFLRCSRLHHKLLQYLMRRNLDPQGIPNENASCFANLNKSHLCHPIHNQATHPKTFRSISSSSLRIIVLPNAILRNHLNPFIQNHSNIVPTRQLSSERGRRTFDHVSLDLEGQTNL